MNNSKRRREAKAAQKVVGNNAMAPTTKNLTRLMKQKGTNRAQRRHHPKITVAQMLDEIERFEMLWNNGKTD